MRFSEMLIEISKMPLGKREGLEQFYEFIGRLSYEEQAKLKAIANFISDSIG